MKFKKLFLTVFFLAAVMEAAGCGGKAVVKTQGALSTLPAAPTAVPVAGFKAPLLVDVRPVVTDDQYKTVLERVGTANANRNNLADYSLIAQYQFNQSNLSDSLKTYQKIIRDISQSPKLDQAQYMVGQIYYEQKEYLSALAAFQNMAGSYPKSPYAKQGYQMMDFILAYSLDVNDLKSFVANYPDSPMKCPALFQLASRESQSGMPTEALGHLNEFVQQCPQDPSLASAQLLIQSLQTQQQVKSWKVGVLVPRTGKYKTFGQSVLNGITMALEQANQSSTLTKKILVSVQDTAGDPLQTVKIFENLSKDGSLDAIVGPVVNSEIDAVAPLANQQRVAMICPSYVRDGLSTLGPYIFNNSMTNEMQGRAIARFAMEHLNFKKFGILAPEDGYGQTLADSFKKTVDALGGTVTAYETYTLNAAGPTSTDFKNQLMSLGGQDPESSKKNDRENVRRFDELKYNLKKEIGKILLKSKEAAESLPGGNNAVALIPVVEGLTNTTCPSIVKDVSESLKEAFQEQQDFVLRNDDLVQQAMKRLPVEATGTTVPVSAEKWADIADDIQASLIVVSRVVETNPPNDSNDHPTWDYLVGFEAYQMDPKKRTYTRIYQRQVPYSAFKPDALVRPRADYQALYLPTHSAEIPLLASLIHFYDLNTTFLGGHLWENKSVLDDAAKDVEGAYFVTGFFRDSEQGTTKKFVQDYVAKFNQVPDLLAAQGYDAANLLLKAIATSMSREDIHNKLLEIKDFDGVCGKTTFGGHGEANKIVPVLKIEGGKYKQVQ